MPLYRKARALRDDRVDARPGNAKAESRSERIWTVFGLVLAAAVFVVAAYEIHVNDGAPKIYGGAHLALFSQPMRARDRIKELSVPLGETEPRPDVALRAEASQIGIDLEATGTIRKPEPSGFEELVEIGPPTLLYVERAQGVFMTTSGKRALRIGERAPTGGTIRFFKRREGRWVAMVAPGQTSR
jgi:hypothetical protein